MNQPRYGKRAPTEEAHQSALQLRRALFDALEAAMDNQWNEVAVACETAALLAKHCHTQEVGMKTRPAKKAWAEDHL